MRRLALTLLLLLSACAETETRYIPPGGFMTGDTPVAAFSSGDACIASCQMEQRQCVQNEQASVGACYGADSAIASGFNGCRPGAASCVPAPICLQNTSACTEAYNACYSRCGGVALQVRRRPAATVSETMPTTPFVVPPLPGSVPAAAPPRRRVRHRAAHVPAPAPGQTEAN